MRKLRFRTPLSTWIAVGGSLILLLPLFAGLVFWSGDRVQAAPAASCSDGNVPPYIESDTTLSGELYVTDDVVVRNDATLTITAGSNVILCGAYEFKVGALFDPGGIVAIGTADTPIVFESYTDTLKWNRLYIGDSFLEHSILQHVIINDAGGDDPSADNAALVINDVFTTSLPAPVIDHVTVNNSGAHGISVALNENEDATPPALSNLSVTGSAGVAMLMDAASVGGLGDGNVFTDNVTNTIRLRSAGNSGIFFSQRWRAQPVPYELPDGMYVRNNDPALPYSTLTLDPGVILLVGEDADITIGSLYGDAQLRAEGTPQLPITITRASDESETWGSLYIDPYSQVDSYLSHVHLLYGGGAASGDRDGVIEHSGDGILDLDNVEIKYSTNAAVYVSGQGGPSPFHITDSTLTFNRVGVEVWDAVGMLRRNGIFNNAEGGLLNNRANDQCIDAIGNYWGDPSGPADSSDTLDACNSAATNAGSGNAVSNGVRYDPWLTTPDSTELLDQSRIFPDPFWLAADGVTTATLIIVLKDAQGTPLVGKEVALVSSRGILTQPTALTDDKGVTHAFIRSDQAGEALITARNVTDGEPVGTMASLYFSSGTQETGGLIEPNGAPYASPQLIVSGRPYQVGFPISFKLPMRNSNTYPVHVEVTYGAAGLNVGENFTTVDVVSKTLQPGEAWDADGSWIPSVTGMHCIESKIKVTPLVATQAEAALFAVQDESNFRLSFNLVVPKTFRFLRKCPGPAGVALIDIITGGSGDLIGNSWPMIPKGCRDAFVDPPSHGYETIATVSPYTPTIITADGDTTPAQAAALNAYSEAVARAYGLAQVIQVTNDRMAGANLAEAWPYASLQAAALRDYMTDYAAALDDVADALDAYLLATEGEGEPDTPIYPEDYAGYLARLKDEGFSPDSADFYAATGLSSAEITALEQATIASLEAGDVHATTVYAVLREMRDQARTLADELTDDLNRGAMTGRAPLATTPVLNTTDIPVPFTVGNPTESAATVELSVRPVALPINWSYSLDRLSLVLDAGETTTVTLTLHPGDAVPEGSRVQVAVEGFISGDYIGGILLQPATPTTTPAQVFLPLSIR